MGIEETLRTIEQLTKEMMGRFGEITSSLKIMVASIGDLKSTTDQLSQEIQNTRISGTLQNSIQTLPQIIQTLEQSISSFQKAFESLAKETRDDLKFIKVSYVEDVVGNMRNLSLQISDMVKTSTEKTKEQYEASITNFLMINDALQQIESGLNSLLENQADQLATVGELRDRVNAIIQVELSSLRDRIVIYLEASVNELKTSVSERMAFQDESLQRLTTSIERMNQNLSALPPVIQQEIDTAVQTKINTQLDSMEKEMKKMTAFIIKSQREKEKVCPHCGKKIN
ncbi:hypothetical protein [Candidatus Hodarchaeum mangrovi]